MVSCDVRGGKYVSGTVLRGCARSTVQHFLMTLVMQISATISHWLNSLAVRLLMFGEYDDNNVFSFKSKHRFQTKPDKLFFGVR